MSYGVNAPGGFKPLCSINGGNWSEKVNEYLIYASADGATTYTSSIYKGDPVTWGTSLGATPQTNGAIGTIAAYVSGYADGTPTVFNTVPILGIFMGCEYLSAVNGTSSIVNSAYWPGASHVIPGTAIKAYVLDDPTIIYDLQVSTNINANAGAFVGNPVFPNTNSTGNAPFNLAGSFGRNFGINVGGGTNFTTVPNPRGGFYTNNPLTGSTLTGQSAFYLDVDTSTAAQNNHDYNKTLTTLPVRALGYSQNVNNIAGPGLTLATTPFLNVRVTINNHVYAVGAASTVYVA